MIVNQSELNRHNLTVMPGDGATVTRYLPSLPQAMQAIASGDWTLIEHKLPPAYGGQRPHAHAQVDMLFYVVEGQPTFQLGEQTFRADVGSWIVANRGTVHTYFNSTHEPARFLAFCVSGPVVDALCEPPGPFDMMRRLA